MTTEFQSQTRRLLPRNDVMLLDIFTVVISFNRRRDACFPATQQYHVAFVAEYLRFNRRRDACFPATLSQ